MRHVTIYLIWHNGVFLDACASYSEAMLITSTHPGHSNGCCKITRREAEDY